MKMPVRPFPPDKNDYLNKRTEHPIYYKYYYLDDCTHPEELLERLDRGCRGLFGQKFEISDLDEFSYDNKICNLAELLKRVPPGVDPEDVTINLHRDRGMDYALIVVKYDKAEDPVAQLQLYKEDSEKYEKAKIQYQKDLAEYKQWKLSTEIEQKEKELKELKDKMGKK